MFNFVRCERGNWSKRDVLIIIRKNYCVNNIQNVVSPSASFQHSEDICKEKGKFTKPVPLDCKRNKPFKKGLDSPKRKRGLA